MSNYIILEKYTYKDFSIVFCYHKDFPKKLISYLRNRKWKRIDFACIEDASIEHLKDKVREFLKNPNLTEINQKNNQIKVFYRKHIQKKEEERKKELLDMIRMINAPEPMAEYNEEQRNKMYDIINEQWQVMYGLHDTFFDDEGSPFIEDFEDL